MLLLLLSKFFSKNFEGFLIGNLFPLALASLANAQRSSTTSTANESESDRKTESESETAPDIEDSQRKEPQALQSWIAYLRKRTGKGVREIAGGMSKTNPEFLMLLGRHPEQVPAAVKAKVSELAETAHGVPREESLEHLNASGSLARAASRQGPHGRPPAGFGEILERSGLAVEEKAYWARIAEKGD